MEIQEKCQAAGCPITAVYTVAEAAEMPHLKARDYFVELEHPELGPHEESGATVQAAGLRSRTACGGTTAGSAQC